MKIEFLAQKQKIISTFLIICFALAVILLQNNLLYADTINQNVGIASSPNPVGSGARAVGMSGAFIGVADDATAASWNPAGLIQLETAELSVVGAYTSGNREFSSKSHPEINHDSEADDNTLNYISGSYPFNLLNRNMVISINYQRLYEFQREMDYRFDFVEEPIFQSTITRYSQDGYLSALGLAYAIETTPWLSFGITLNLWTDDLWWRNGWSESYIFNRETTIGNTTIVSDITISDDYSDFSGENVNLGVLWDINRYLTMGAVIKTPFTASLQHVYTDSRLPASITEKIELDMPMSYGIGTAIRFSDKLTIDLDVYRTEWSKYILTDSQGNKFCPIDGRPENESDVKDTTQVRAGGEYLIINPSKNLVIPLRAGIFYDPEPSQGSPEDFYGMTLGSGIGFKRFILDFAYELRWAQSIDSSSLIGTGNGDALADVMQHTLLASVIWHF